MTADGAPHRVVASNFIALASGEAVARILAFCTTVYIARTLGAEYYGIVGFALAVILYMSRIADAGMEHFGLGVREIAEDRSRITSLAPDLITARVVIAAVVAAILMLIGLTSREQPDGLVLSVYALTLLMVGAGTRWIHLGLESTRSVALARAIGEGSVVLLVLALVHGPADVTRVPLAQLVGDGIAATLLFLYLRRRGYSLPVRLDVQRVLPVFRRAAPLIVSTLLGLIIYNSDLIFLRVFHDARTVGFYAAAYTLVSFMINLGGAYSQSLMPTLTRVGPGGDARVSLYHRAVAQVFALTLPVAIGGSIIAPQIVELVFGQEYRGPSGLALQLLLWTVPVALLREISVVALVVTGAQSSVLRVTGWAAALSVVLNLLLIPRYGIPGAAIATGATEVVRLMLAIGYARSAGVSRPTARLLWRPVVAGVAMLGVLLMLKPPLLWQTVAAGAITYAAVLAVVGGLRHGPRPALIA